MDAQAATLRTFSKYTQCCANWQCADHLYTSANQSASFRRRRRQLNGHRAGQQAQGENETSVDRFDPEPIALRF
jgi:hypothetical protein